MTRQRARAIEVVREVAGKASPRPRSRLRARIGSRVDPAEMWPFESYVRGVKDLDGRSNVLPPQLTSRSSMCCAAARSTHARDEL
jgi:hypothetical protein